MGKKPQKYTPIKPKRSSELWVALWIGTISTFIALNILVDGQFRWGNGTDGTLITASRNPIMFTTGVLFPAAVSTFMITRVIRAERHYRASLKLFHDQMNNDGA